MKVFFKIIFLLILPTLFLFSNNVTFAVEFCDKDTGICTEQNENKTFIWDQSWSTYSWWIFSWWIYFRNNHLEEILSDNDFTVSWLRNWDQWVYNIIIRIARDLKNLVFTISTIYFFIIVFKLLLSENTEEELGNFKKWIIWISIWILVMQVAYSLVRVLTVYNWWVIWQPLWEAVYSYILNPLISMLEMWASFVFIAIAIYAFYKIVTSNWDEEKAKDWKMTIFYSILWFIVIKISRKIVEAVYWKINCTNWDTAFFIFQNDRCIQKANLNEFSNIVLNLINWVNWFVWIITVIMIIYVWAQIFLSAWDEDKLKNGKKAIIYIVIWLLVLVTNYLILTFFFPTTTTI